MFGPSAPAAPQELTDWAQIADQEAAGLAYKLKLLDAVQEGDKFAFQPDAPFAHEAMVEAVAKAAKVLNVEPAVLESKFSFQPPLSRVQAARVLVDAMVASGLVIVAESVKADSYTIPAGATVVAPAGKQVTLTVNGVQTRLAPGTYTGDVQLTVTDDYVISNMGNTYFARMGAYICDGLVPEKSVSAAIKAGTVTDTEAEGVVLESHDDNFNGIVVDGDGEYLIKDCKMVLDGHGGDDFAGYGAGIMTTGNAKVTIDNAEIDTTGAIRTAIWCGGNSKVLVKNSTVVGHDGQDMNFRPGMMKEVPWVLGLKGNLRATNVLGSANVTYLNSKVSAEYWGAMSTDSCRPGSTLTTINTDMKITGSSGYGSYADVVIRNAYYGTHFDVPDFGLIVASGDCGATFGAATRENAGDLYDQLPDDRKDAPTVVDSKRMGVMWHKNEKGVVTVKEGTVFNCGGTVFVAKSDPEKPCYPVLNVDNAVLNTGNGIILHMMESDDAGMGTGGPGSDNMWADKYVVPEVKPVKDDNDITDPNAPKTLEATFSNMAMSGDIYNSHWTVGQNLSVTLDNAQATGVISGGVQHHVNAAPGQAITRDQYWELANVAVEAAPIVSNGVLLTLKNGSTWTVAGKSYLSYLSVGDGCTVTGKVTVNGQPTAVRPGQTYTGEIVVEA
jgi:hypothetical protein